MLYVRLIISAYLSAARDSRGAYVKAFEKDRSVARDGELRVAFAKLNARYSAHLRVQGYFCTAPRKLPPFQRRIERDRCAITDYSLINT